MKVWCVLTPLLSTFQYPEENENGETLRVCDERSVVKHVLFTIGAGRPEDRQTDLAEQALMS